MHEGFEKAPGKKRKGLIWATSVDKTHSRVFVSYKIENPWTKYWKIDDVSTI